MNGSHDAQSMLRDLERVAREISGLGVDWVEASETWATARLGLTFRGGFVELLEDNGELCLLAGGVPATPLDTLVPRGDRVTAELVFSFSLGVAFGLGMA